MDGYCYTVNNKKGKPIDFWIMDKPTPKEASVIMSCRFSRYIKPTRDRFEALINDALNQELKSQMPNEQVAWEQGYEAGLAQGKHERPQGEWQGGELGHCTNCGHKGSASDIWNNCTGMFCPNCGAHLTDV